MIALLAGVAIALVVFTEYESYSSLYDAEYVGAATCGECHSQIFPRWQGSPHAKMTRKADSATVVGDFTNATWFRDEDDSMPAASMYREGERYFMALRHPQTAAFVPFEIEYVVGYQYRQTYLTREPGGVLRRLPLQWSTSRRVFFPYWNFQEGSDPTLQDLWAQMGTLNSAWNLFCARCHTTKLRIESMDAGHTRAVTSWVDDGIACEACHGPGSQHVNYMAGNPVNRLAAFLNNHARGQPVAYIANARDLNKGQSMSVCARCHGSDILRSTMDIYRRFEPGYSQEGRLNDLSMHFKEAPLVPGHDQPTVEVWKDGRPKGIGMLFRSFVESACYEKGEARCYDCHDPHDNKKPVRPGLLIASSASNGYCLGCHRGAAAGAVGHSRHVEGEPGSFCYDCHMPRHIANAATGQLRFVRSHEMSSVPDPAASVRHGQDGAPNACNDCHAGRSPQWAQQVVEEWY